MSYDLARDNNASVGKATIIFMLTTLTTGISTFAGSNNPPGCFTFKGEVRNTGLYNLILGTGADLLNNAYQEVLNDRISEREETEKSNYKTSNNPSGNHNASWGDDLKGKRMNKNYCIENPV